MPIIDIHTHCFPRPADDPFGVAEKLRGTPAEPHPTLSEMMKQAVLDAYGGCSIFKACRPVCSAASWPICRARRGLSSKCRAAVG